MKAKSKPSSVSYSSPRSDPIRRSNPSILKDFGSLTLAHDEDKGMASLLKKNHSLESFQNIDLEKEARDVGAILRLNGAGRRYLIEDGSSSITKGSKC
jgi:hypothetical protein